MPRSSFRTPPRTRRPRTIPRNIVSNRLRERHAGLENVRRNLALELETGIASMNSPTSIAAFDNNFQYRQDLYDRDGGRKRKSRKKGRKSRKSRRRNKRKSRKKRTRRKSRKRRRR